MVRVEDRVAAQPGARDPQTHAVVIKASVPRELWVVIGLLALVGGVMLYQELPLLPDVVEYTFDSSIFDSLGLFYVAYLVELCLLGIVLLVLSRRVSLGDRGARLTAALLCAALAVSYVLQEDRADTENTVMVLASVVAGALALAPATRAWFAARHDTSPLAPVTAARSIAAGMAVALGLLGVAVLPAMSLAGVFGFIGAGLGIGGVLSLRSLGGVRAGDADARIVLSSVMVGEIVLLVLARVEAPAAEALVVPMALAAGVVALLWVPGASRLHFSRAPVAAPAQAPVLAPRSAPSPKPRAQPVVTTLRPPAPAPVVTPPSPVVTPPAPAPEPQPPPPPPTPAPPPVSRPQPPPRPPAPAPVPPPAVETVIYVEVGVVPGSRLAKTSPLQLVYDQESWFPEPAAKEDVIGAYLVLMLLHGEAGPGDRIFEGTSSLLITERRLAGVCPKGHTRNRVLDSTRGPVIPWSVPLEAVSPATAATSRSGPYLSMSVAGTNGARILFANPRIVRGGAFVPVDIGQLARDLKRARPPAPPPPPPSPSPPTPSRVPDISSILG